MGALSSLNGPMDDKGKIAIFIGEWEFRWIEVIGEREKDRAAFYTLQTEYNPAIALFWIILHKYSLLD